MKKKNIIFLIIILVLLVGLLILFNINKPTEEKPKKIDDSICAEISFSKENKESFIVFANSDNKSIMDTNEAINEFKAKYNNVKMYEIDSDTLKLECMSDALRDTGLYGDLIKYNNPVMIGYYDGEYVGSHQNPLDIGIIEEYFEGVKIIEIIKVPELGINYEQYKEKIKHDEYLLVVVADEKSRENIDKSMKEYFPDKEYGIINLKSEEGTKILSDIKTNNEISLVFPRIFYYQKGKLLLNSKCANSFDLEKFKASIEKLQ